ncbi:sulfite oxidase heme-binding subunit YedZ [Marinicellulosiphila megalodicopiae]|uniref:sulfite oxidase heme-binding subunit YedZ n=1 Tax=Marinicellulosiphila megalodicopiae TaxID=2724896 RepID=UPI003BAF51FC
MNAKRIKQLAWWWGIFLIALVPLIVNIIEIIKLQKGLPNQLGSEPGKVLVDRFGEITLISLWIVLAITPLKKWLGFSKLVKFRRMLGLYVFFYASLHILSYGTFLLEWSWYLLMEDVAQRPYIFVGFVAWLGLTVLSITSPKWMMKKLKKKWVVIHRFVYVIAILTVVHEWMQVRDTFFEPLMHALVLFVLLCLRLPFLLNLRFKK